MNEEEKIFLRSKAFEIEMDARRFRNELDKENLNSGKLSRISSELDWAYEMLSTEMENFNVREWQKLGGQLCSNRKK